MLKIYGDAPETVSVSIVTFALDNDGFAFRSTGKLESLYVNFLVLATLATLVEILYSDVPTPLIFIGVPTFKLWSTFVVTVTTLLAVIPSPDTTSVIVIESSPKAPTISYSGLTFAISPSVISIALLVAALYALDNFL